MNEWQAVHIYMDQIRCGIFYSPMSQDHEGSTLLPVYPEIIFGENKGEGVNLESLS